MQSAAGTTEQQRQNMAVRLFTLAHLLLEGWQTNALRLFIVHYAFVFLRALAIAPIVAGLGNILIGLSGNAVLADYEIASFFTSPLGLLGAFVFAILATALGLLELVTLLVALDRPERPWTASRNALFVTLGMLPRLAVFAYKLIKRLAMAALPGLLIILATIAYSLQTYDINYYLQEKPPEFWLAALIIAVGAVILGALLLLAVLTWGLSLPLVALRDHPIASVFARARFLSRGLRSVFAGAAILWLLLYAVINACFLLLLEAAGSYAISWANGEAMTLEFLLGSLVAILVVGNTLITAVLTGSLAILLKAALFLADGKGHDFHETTEAKPFRNKWSDRITPLRLASAICLLTLISVVSGAYWVSADLPQKDVLIIAHRGASLEAPENTIAAIEKAISDGSDWVEIDVQQAADGTLVLSHDSDFMRLSQNPTRIWDMTLEELRGIDVGAWFNSAFAGETIATLGEALSAAKGRATLLIELKFYPNSLREDMEADVYRAVFEAGMEDQIAVMSLDRASLQKMHKIAPDWNIGLLTATSIGNFSELQGNFVAISAASASLNVIRRLQETEKQVFVWTVNNPSTMLRYVTMGVDGIITDDPALARKTLEEYKQMNQFERLLLHTSVLYNLSLN